MNISCMGYSLTGKASFAAGWALCVGVALCLPTYALATPRQVVVTITSVECTQDDECDAAGLEAATQSWPDFYAKIFINGVETRTSRAPDDQKRVEPTGWTATATIDDAVLPLVPVGIQIWDYDSTSGDDLADASPMPDDNNLDLVLNLATGSWSGDATTGCATGDGVDSDDDEYYPVKICFDIVADTDQDGDGLLDRWETAGFDANGDGVIDVDLPAMGANPLRQDIFLELDYEAARAPTRDGIAAMKRAFALAPRPNPDGSTGITLHVDVGRLVDPGADEAGLAGTCTNGLDDDGDRLVDGNDTSCTFPETNREVVPGNCTNGIDDDLDGNPDGADPNCLVGDNLGGGQVLPAVGACKLDAVFVSTKTANFNILRSRIFHYAIQAQAPVAPPGAAPLGCAGGQGEVGGNDFISHNTDPGTVMHELGHNLRLEHGGSVVDNCKPNYISVMNYNLQGGIPRVAGGLILDYSPPRRAFDGSTRSVPLGPLVENALNENNPVDSADTSNQTVFMNLNNQIVTLPLNARPNYDADTANPPFETGVTANIDNGIAAVPPATINIGAPGCANTATGSTLNGDNDWNALALNFRQFAAGAEGEVIAPVNEDSPTDEVINQMQIDRHKTDLVISLSATPDPVASGTNISYVATAANAGPNPADATVLTFAVPPETTLVGSLPANCTTPAPGSVLCDIGKVLAGSSGSVTIVAETPADLVYNAGAPLSVTATASVEDRAGTEMNAADNLTTIAVKVVAVADLSVLAVTIDNPPVQMRVAEQVVINLNTVISSAGPSSPMDAHMTLTASADAGAAVSPTALITSQTAVLAAQTRGLNDHVILLCRTRGAHVFEFAHRIDPTRAPDTDPVAANDSRSATLQVECLGPDEVVINVQPGQNPNVIQSDTREVSLAILTTLAGEYGRAAAFDATDIDPQSLHIGSRRMVEGLEPGTQQFGAISLQDSLEPTPPETLHDQDMDLVISTFDMSRTGVVVGDTEMCVIGRYKDRATGGQQDFYGCDAVTLRP